MKDETSSLESASTADNTSRSDTPTRGRKKGRGSSLATGGRWHYKHNKLAFRCVSHVKEEHGQPIFGVQFNWHLHGSNDVFASVGSNRVTPLVCYAI